MKEQLKKYFMFAAICSSSVLLLFLVFDFQASRDYVMLESRTEFDTSYHQKFEELILDVESGDSTGIPSIDDAGVTYGDAVNVTLGSGDFANFTPGRGTQKKTWTTMNTRVNSSIEPIGPRKWSATSSVYRFLYSKSAYENSTIYDKSGVIKLFDRYSWVAMGSYWYKKFNLPEHVGATYRITLDSGATFDIISTDAINNSDSTAVKAPGGKDAIAHVSGADYKFVEFEIIDFRAAYPIWDGGDAKHPPIDLGGWSKKKSDPSHVSVLSSGNCDIIPEFNGNVISIQVIHDPKVEALVEQAKKETGEILAVAGK